MFRRNFLKWLGVSPVVGIALEGYQPIVKSSSLPPQGGILLLPPREDDNPNNLPVVKFSEDGKIANLKELIGEIPDPAIYCPKYSLPMSCGDSSEKTILVWVKEWDKLNLTVFGSATDKLLFGELKLSVTKYYNFNYELVTRVKFSISKNSKFTSIKYKNQYCYTIMGDN